MLYLLLSSSAYADYSKRNPFMLVLLIILAVAFLAVGGIILYRYLMGKKNSPAMPTEEDGASEAGMPDNEEQPQAESKEQPAPVAMPEENGENEPQA